MLEHTSIHVSPRACFRTLSARSCGLSMGNTGTTLWAMIAPRSYSSSTKCTVGPLNLRGGGGRSKGGSRQTQWICSGQKRDGKATD